MLKWLFVSAFSVLVLNSALAAPTKMDGLYVNTFGNSKDKALIFVHGGPGYNSWDFELTTAPTLASKGYFVVVYDERGQGRSDEAPLSDFNYKKYADDIKMIIDSLHLNHPSLIGHSHGGPIALKFDEYYPGVAQAIVLASGPINFWGSMMSMFENCSARYAADNNQPPLDDLTYAYYQMAIRPTVSEDERIHALSTVFIHGIKCKLYNTSHPTPSELYLRAEVKQNPVSGPLSGKTTAMPGFLKNENYIEGNYVDFVLENQSHIFGIYGNEDGLFTPLEISLIKNAVSPEHFKLISGASHYVYIDQQDEFINAVETFMGH